MSFFKRKKKNNNNNSSSHKRTGSNESVLTAVSTTPSIHAVWRKGLSASGSTWKARAALPIGHDLLVLGAHQPTADNTEPPNQLYICDTLKMQWSMADLKGKGPGLAAFYSAITSRAMDKLLVLWPCPQRGKVARVVQSFDAKKTGELTIEEGKLFLVLDETDSIWIGGTTQEGGMGIVPRSCLSFDNVPIQQTTRLELSVLNFMSDMQWSTMSCDGDQPKARKHFTVTQAGNKIFLIGGLSDFNESINTVYSLDIDKYHWRRCTSKVTLPPKARYGHAAAMIDPAHILLFGDRKSVV